MLTPEDIELMTEIFATREEVVTNFSTLEAKFDALQTSVDKLVKIAKIEQEKDAIIPHKVERLEKWAVEAGKKIDVPLTL